MLARKRGAGGAREHGHRWPLRALTPVVGLPSLLAKIGVMQEQELDELEIAGRPVLELLAQDVQRLI